MSWREQALCKASDVEDYTFKECEDIGVSPARGSMMYGYNRNRLKAVAEKCNHCPVRNECLSSASEGDRFWTVRGGQLPTVLESRSLKRHPESGAGEYISK